MGHTKRVPDGRMGNKGEPYRQLYCFWRDEEVISYPYKKLDPELREHRVILQGREEAVII